MFAEVERRMMIERVGAMTAEEKAAAIARNLTVALFHKVMSLSDITAGHLETNSFCFTETLETLPKDTHRVVVTVERVGGE